MSFGFSIGDAVVLTQLASRAVQNSRKACGAHDELTHELTSLQLVLGRLKDEAAKTESPINRPGDSCQEELESLVVGSEKILKILESILHKYSSLSQEERSGQKLWQRIRFGNGEMQDLAELRAKLTYYTSALSLFLNMMSVGSIGRVEKHMHEAGGDLREIRLAVNGITAQLLASKDREGSVLTTYADDDRAVWKEFRRELVTDGFSSSTIRKYKGLIKAYIKELAERGLLDEDDPYEQGDPHDRLNQGAVAMSENGQSPSIVSSPDESTADAVSESGRQAVANQEKPDPEREGHKRNAREAEIARMQAERDAEFVQRDANEDPGGSLHKENRHVQSAEPIRGPQEQEELDREKGRQRHEQEDPERLQAAEHLEKLSLADNASSETTTSVQMIETDSESSTCEFENGLGYDTAWTRLRPDDDAGNSEPPPWLQDRGNYDLDYDGPSHPAYVLVAAPYGICVAAPYCKDGRAYTNVSLIWWHFWLRTETIDKSLSAPDVSRVLSTDAEIEPLIRRNIERLYALGDASTNILAHIVSGEVVVVSDDYSLVSCHRSFLEYVMKGAWGEEAFMKIIHRIIDWILEYELVEGLTTFTSVRQWLDLTRLDTEATYECLPRTPSGIYSSFEPWDPIESDSRPELRATVANAASIAWHCKEVETHVHETRTTWSHFQASLASAPDSLQLKTWRRYYYIKIAPVCREFLSGLLATDSKVYEDTLGMLQEWVEEHYVTDLVHFDLQGRPDLEKVRREGLREVHGLIQAMMERKHTLKTFVQLDSIECLLYSELKPKCVLFVSNPPKKANIRDVEYKKLSETLLSRVILELDAVKTMGDRELIAAKRKQLIWETQAMLSELDAVRKR